MRFEHSIVIFSTNASLSSSRRSYAIKFLVQATLLFLSSLMMPLVHAQNIQFTQGSVDSSLDASINIPLRSYPERGVSLPITLSYSSRVWRLSHLATVNDISAYTSIVEAIYAEHSKAGWKTTLDIPEIEWPKDTDTYYYTGNSFCQVCGSSFRQFRIARVYIRMPDGSSHELRKSDQPYEGAVDKLGTFYAVDGSRLRYDSTGVNTGTLYLPDGRRYILNGNNVQFIDCNGNTLSYDVSTRSWSDALGRTISIPLPLNPQAQDYTYTIPGLGNTSLTYTFRWKNLADALTPNPATGLPPARKPIANNYLNFPDLPPTNYQGNNYPQWVQPVWGPERPSLFITDSPDGESRETYVVGHGQVQGTLFNPVVLAEIIFPNGTSYKFSYNIYGEIDKIIYPTGAYETYQYNEVLAVGDVKSPYSQTNRGVTKRQLSVNGSGSDTVEWQYAIADRYSDLTVPLDSLRTTMTAPDGTRTETYRHNLRTPVHPGHSNALFWAFGFEDARQGMVFEESVYAPNPDGSKGPMIRRNLTEWARTTNAVPPRIGLPGEVTETAYRNARPVKEVSIFLEGTGSALAKTTTHQYDTTNQMTTGVDRTVTTESQFAVVDQTTAQTAAASAFSIGTVSRITEISYATDSSYLSRNLLGLPTSNTLKDGAGQIVAKTETAYDESSYYPLPYGITASYWIDPGTNTKRGLVTTVRRYVDVSAGTYIETHSQYDQFGNLRYSWDGKGNRSEIEYLADYAYTYPTKTISPIPDLGGSKGSNVALQTMTAYDPKTGLITSSTDYNLNVTGFEYNDSLLRRTAEIMPAGGGRTDFQYSDTPGNIFVKTLKQLDASRSFEKTKFLDGVARTWRETTKESGTLIQTDTQYDQMGRVWKISNPYRSGETPQWTTKTYDYLSREKTVVSPDGSQLSITYGLVVSGSIIGTSSTMTDQAGHQQRSVTDSLERIVRVDEPDANNNLGAANNPVLPTIYTYDALGNLRKVEQGAQQRYFMYDAISRLIRLRQPEQAVLSSLALYDSVTDNGQWTQSYEYDGNGNISSRIDARGIRTNYSYDTLDRVTRQDYVVTVVPAPANYSATSSVDYYYDGKGVIPAPANSLGRMCAYSSSVAAYQFSNFDAVGRVTGTRQVVDGQSYSVAYQYDLAGNLVSQTYPSGRTVAQSYDVAGRLSSVSGRLPNRAPKSFAGEFSYAPHGGVKNVQLGNGLWEHTNFNERMQPVEIGLGTTKTDASVLKLEYNYGSSDNNGNLRSQTITVPGLAAPFVQSYTYDPLNRLLTASETSNSAPVWKQTFSYDRYGNRSVNTQEDATTPSLIGPNPVISEATNRVLPQAGEQYGYDEDGSLTSDRTGRQFVYDGENRQTQYTAAGSPSPTAYYFYDGNGKRVKKVVGNETLIFVYNALGQQVAEYSTTTPPTNPQTSYLTADALGSPRVNTNANRQVQARHDYLPFGEEIVGLGNRNSTVGYTVDNVRQKFTAKERDEENGLDFFNARYYGSSSGRFTSTDPLGPWAMSKEEKPGFLNAPQQWNRYAYCLNNPLKLTDPSGMEVYDPNIDLETQRRIHARLVYISQHGTTKQRMIANFILKNNVRVTYETRGEPTAVPGAEFVQPNVGVTDVNAANKAISQGPLTMKQASGFVEMRIPETIAKQLDADGKFKTAEQLATVLEEALVHEGKHAYDLTRVIQGLSDPNGPNGCFDPTQFKAEYFAFMSEASYLATQRGTEGQDIGSYRTLLRPTFEQNGEQFTTRYQINEKSIRNVIQNQYSVAQDNQGPRMSEMYRLRPKQ